MAILIPSLWFALAYGGLPRLWSHHEHKLGRRYGDLVSYTAQGIPGDPLNLEIDGSQAEIECRLKQGGWIEADPVTIDSGIRIGTSVLFNRSYPNAPVSPLYVHDKVQDMAFERDEGKSAHRRHHVRFWQVSPNHWLGSATYDRGVGLSLFTLQITHHIGPDVDEERDAVARLVSIGGISAMADQNSAVPRKPKRNGGGDRYLTDGKVARITAEGACGA